MNTFEDTIKYYLQEKYKKISDKIFTASYILQYLVLKTKSANKGSKSRASFANLYAIYVIIEDYLQKGYGKKSGYSKYDGAKFSDLLARQRELPFGSKLQNHAINARMNEEFFKYFPIQKGIPPIVHDLKTQRYWFNENYLKIKVGKKTYNIAEDIIHIIDMYVAVKQNNLKKFIEQCKKLQSFDSKDSKEVFDFIISLLAPNIDARLFEIVSYSILKFYYVDTKIYWGFKTTDLKEENLKLYKTGRTNANDGGIDFVMRPLGRFFQVTETIDFKKYFLDIDKIEHYPISFVVKTDEPSKTLMQKLKVDAMKTYGVKKVVNAYISCIEEIINIPTLQTYLAKLNEQKKIPLVLGEIIEQSKVEFNYDNEE